MEKHKKLERRLAIGNSVITWLIIILLAMMIIVANAKL